MKNAKKSLALASILLLSAAISSAAAIPREHPRTMADHTGMCSMTLSAMHSLQTAVDAYAIDHGTYPGASTMEELAGFIAPMYIRDVPMKDVWGTPFRYIVSADRKSCRIISAGSDRKFDEASWNTPGLLTSSADDAVLPDDGESREWIIQQ